MGFGRRRGEVIGDEPENTDSDPDSSEKAVSQGEGRTGLPLLSALRQDLPRGHPCPCLRVGESQSRGSGRRWPEVRGNRDGRAGEVAGGYQEWTSEEDVPATAGATGDDPETRRRGKATGDTDDKGPRGADLGQAGAGA